MTTPAEDALYCALTDIEDLERLARMGLPEEAIPTEGMRPVVAWALNYYFESGRRQAPTRNILLQVKGPDIEEAGVELLPEDEERDTIESAVAALKGLHADREWQTFIKAAATEMASASHDEKVERLTEITNLLFSVTSNLKDLTNQVEGAQGFSDSWTAYQERKATGHSVTGLTFGWDPIDLHCGGVRDGELAILAAGPKTGKSYVLDLVAYREWLKGRHTVLFTLENSVEMTYDRMMCLAVGVSPRAYQRGLLNEDQEALVARFQAEVMPEIKSGLHVISPPRKARTPEMIVREAMMLGAESILVDQLTHVEHPNPGRKARHEIFSENVHEFKYLISTGRERVPMLLAHQINRDGVKAADKIGHHEMFHLAESAGVERAADWVFSLYQSKTDRSARQALFQILAARREDTKNWALYWDVESGGNRVRQEVSLDD